MPTFHLRTTNSNVSLGFISKPLTVAATTLPSLCARFNFALLRFCSDKVHADLLELYLRRLEDKISAVRTAASDCVRSIWTFLSVDRANRTARRIRALASEDTRSEVRAVALRSLPLTEESSKVLVERTGDYDGSVRTASFSRLAELPVEFFTIESVHTLSNNAYTAALSYEASSTRDTEPEEEPQPLGEVREIYFSAASRRRREETALYNVLAMFLKEADDNIWAFLNWFPLDSNPQAVLFILSTLFSRGLEFPADFSTREMLEPLDPQKNIAVAIVFCERLAKLPHGKAEIESLVPEPLDVCDEFSSSLDAPNSSKVFLLLRMAKFLDYSDESGRSGMESMLMDILRQKPDIPIVKLVLANARLVQNVVQIYTQQVVEIIVDQWVDLTDPSSYGGALAVTLELLASLPADSVEFPALARIEEDILAPAKRYVTDAQDAALHALYVKSLSHLGRWVARTREDNFDDLCFWVSNPKKSAPLRAAAITTLVDWFLMPNVQMPSGALDLDGLANALLKIVRTSLLNAPLTFAAVAGLTRLFFSNTVTTDTTISQFMQSSFTKMTTDPRLKTVLASFFPTWASYPDARPIVLAGFLHMIRHAPEDVPAAQRKMILRYSLRLIFEHAESEEVGEYNASISKKCLKTIYASSDRADVWDVMKELDFNGVSNDDKEQIDRMLGKVTTKFAVHLPIAKKILSRMLQPGESKKRASAKFPEPPVKKDKASNAGGRIALDSAAHKLLARTASPYLDANSKKRRREELLSSKADADEEKGDAEDEDKDELVVSFNKPTQAARNALMSQRRIEFEGLEDYELVTVQDKTPVKASSKSKRAVAAPVQPRTPEARGKSKAAIPQTEPRRKRPKLAEWDEEPEEEFTDANALLQKLELQLGTDPKVLQKIKDLTALVAHSPRKDTPNGKNSANGDSNGNGTTARRLVSRKALGGKMLDDIEDPVEEVEEPRTSRPKRGRVSTSVAPMTQTPVPAGRPLRSRTAASAEKASSSQVNESISDDDEVAPEMPTPKRSKRLEASSRADITSPSSSQVASQSVTSPSRATRAKRKELEIDEEAPSQASAVTPSQRATRSARLASASTESIEVQKSKAKTVEDPQTDWKKMHFPSLTAPRQHGVVGLLGFGAHRDQLNEYIEELKELDIEAVEVIAFDKAANITHLVLRSNEHSRTSSCYGIAGTWIMSTKWLDAIIKKGAWVAEDKFGSRINKSIFSGQATFFSPQLQANSALKRIAQSIVKENGGTVTINGGKAHHILATLQDDISYLLEQFEGMPIISLTKLLDDIHQRV